MESCREPGRRGGVIADRIGIEASFESWTTDTYDETDLKVMYLTDPDTYSVDQSVYYGLLRETL